MNSSNNGQYVFVIYLLLAIYLMPQFVGAGWQNDLTNWAATASLVENVSFDVSWTKETVGDNFSNIQNASNGAIYPKNAPGFAIISAPIYALARAVLGPPTAENLRTSWYVLRVVFSTLPLLLFAGWLVSKEVDGFVISILLFATPLFAYSLFYSPNILTAILVYFAFRKIYDLRRVMPERCFSAGLMIGLAFLLNYVAIIPLLIFGLVLFKTEPLESRRRALFYFAAVIPFFFIALLYNQIVLGSVFEILPQLKLATFTEMFGSFFSPARGIFFFSPILLFSLVTFFDSPDRSFRRHRVKLATILLTTLTVVLFSHPNQSDFSVANFIIVLPLVLDSFFDGEIDEFPSLLRGFLILCSMFFCILPLLTYTFAPTSLTIPQNSFWAPLIYNQQFFVLNIVSTFGVRNTVWLLLPIGILFLVTLSVLWRDERFPFRFLLGVILAMVVVAAYLYFPTVDAEEAPGAIQNVINLKNQQPNF
ncbi:MAG: hypothetical protein ACK5NT_07300 [Pyrinomonadaceae bacterium]